MFAVSWDEKQVEMLEIQNTRTGKHYHTYPALVVIVGLLVGYPKNEMLDYAWNIIKPKFAS